MEEATLPAWWDQGPPQQGAQFQFSDLARECLLTLRAVDHLTLRAPEGFARSLFELRVVDLSVPDSSTLGRRAKTVRLRLPKTAEGPLHLVRDSTGLKVYDQGAGKVRHHGSSPRRTGPKLPLAVDPEPHEIPAAVVSEPGVTEAEAVPALREQVENPVAKATGEGMSDRREGDEAWDLRSARAVIPPRREAKIQRPGHSSGPGGTGMRTSDASVRWGGRGGSRSRATTGVRWPRRRGSEGRRSLAPGSPAGVTSSGRRRWVSVAGR